MRALLRLGAFAVVVSCWCWYFVTNWRALASYPWQFASLPTALALGFWLCYFALMALGWVLAVRGNGAKVGAMAGSRIWLSSMPARYVPGNVWHVASRIYLAAQVGVPKEVTVVSSTVEQVLTVASELIVFLALLPLWPLQQKQIGLAPLFAVVLALCGLHPRLFGLALRVVSRITKRPLSVTPLRYRQLLLLLLWYVAAALVNGVAFLLIAGSLAAAGNVTPAVYIGAYLLARAIGFLSLLTPAGLGVREAVIVALLAPYVTIPLATAAGLLARLASTTAELLSVLAINLLVVALRRRAEASAEAQA